jgi:hypothetical protein
MTNHYQLILVSYLVGLTNHRTKMRDVNEYLCWKPIL